MSPKANAPKGCVTTQQSDRFYFLWRRLLRYVNQRERIAKGFLAGDIDKDRMPVEQAVQIRDALWNSKTLLADYVRENPDELAQSDLDLLSSWEQRVTGDFIIMRVARKGALMSGAGEGGDAIYAVKGLQSPIDEVVPFMPCFVKAVLLPFQDVIIYDGLMQSYNMYIGSNMRAGFKETLADAEERGAIITSLTSKPSPEDALARTQETNARVLKAYEMFLRGSIASEKTVERHLSVAHSIAGNLANRTTPHNLRQLEWADLQAELQLARTMMKPSEFKQSITSLMKMVRFLQNSGRLDWEQAAMILVELKEM